MLPLRDAVPLTVVASTMTALVLLTVAAAAQPSGDVTEILSSVGERIQHYYGRAQSIMCLEKVTVQPIRGDLTPEGFARVIEYELHVEWEAGGDGAVADATVHRQVRKVNGRLPKAGEEPKCMDPRSISPEPLVFMLPGHRDDYLFSLSGFGRDRNRAAMFLDYKPRVVGKPEVTYKDDCTSVSLPNWEKGRVWVDPNTHDVIRVEQALVKRFDHRVPYERVRQGMGEYWTLERSDTSIRYRPVMFRDPEEIVLLPESISSLTVFRGPGVVGNRTTQTFSDYKRFITGGRIVK
jgi:hypothetical protein